MTRNDGGRDGRGNKPSVPTPEELIKMSETVFYAVVDRDVRTRSDDEGRLIATLRDPAILERWYQTLLRMKKAVEGTIAARSAENKAKRITCERTAREQRRLASELRRQIKETDDPAVAAELGQRLGLALEMGDQAVAEAEEIHKEYLSWRAGSLRFKTGVEERLSEASWRRNMVVQDSALSVSTTEHARFALRVGELVEAIKTHRSELDPDDASEIDDALYRAAGLTPKRIDGASRGSRDSANKIKN